MALSNVVFSSRGGSNPQDLKTSDPAEMGTAHLPEGENIAMCLAHPRIATGCLAGSREWF